MQIHLWYHLLADCLGLQHLSSLGESNSLEGFTLLMAWIKLGFQTCFGCHPRLLTFNWTSVPISLSTCESDMEADMNSLSPFLCFLYSAYLWPLQLSSMCNCRLKAFKCTTLWKDLQEGTLVWQEHKQIGAQYAICCPAASPLMLYCGELNIYLEQLVCI